MLITITNKESTYIYVLDTQKSDISITYNNMKTCVRVSGYAYV